MHPLLQHASAAQSKPSCKTHAPSSQTLPSTQGFAKPPHRHTLRSVGISPYITPPVSPAARLPHSWTRRDGSIWFSVFCILRSLRLVAGRLALSVYVTTDEWPEHLYGLNSPASRWMYIPLSPRELPSAAPHRRDVEGLLGDGRLHRLLARQFSDKPVENTNIRTGIIVGVVLGVFLIGLILFFYWYRYTVRFSYRKKRRHRHKTGSRSSKSSKSSKSSDGGGGAPDPPAEEAPEDG